MDVSGSVPAIYKEVVIIGNGPSAITLSYLLSGNRPFYKASVHPIDFLHYRLDEARDKSLLDQDLKYLSEGLEGRSIHPVSLLFDVLSHPEADLGLDLPSALEWRHDPDEAVDHVCLGKGLPGGAWQKMEGNTLTISLGSWMELPNFKFKDWYSVNNKNGNGIRQTRATVASVSRYYARYVEKQGLSEHFVNHATVTSVRSTTDDAVGEFCKSLPGGTHHARLWEVTGHSFETGGALRLFRYVAPYVVLATGNSDEPNPLSVPGETLPFVTHSLSDLERKISRGELGPGSDAVVVVGAGLSAADAVIAARFHGVPTAHVFRRSADDPEIIFNKLPQNMYPEYHKVHRMMDDVDGEFYEGYRPYPQCTVSQILPDGRVIVEPVSDAKGMDRRRGADGVVEIRASYVVALTGMHPDLGFLPNSGRDLGERHGKPVDCRHNPVDVDLYTYECVNCPGMFAMGPLVGDNFVRFIQGAALGIAAHLCRVLRSCRRDGAR